MLITPLISALSLSLGARLSVAASAIQEHGAESAGEAAAQAAHGAGQVAEHAEEWGTDAMIHHIVDSDYLEFFGWEIPLDALSIPAFHLGPLTVDMSITKHVFFLMLATVLTLVTLLLAAHRARRTEIEGQAPRGILNVFESLYVYLRDEVALANIGHGGEAFVPYVVTLFFFILYANLLGLLPQGSTATANIMVTSALALISLTVVEVAGFKALGTRGYLKTIFYVPPGLNPAMAAIMLLIMTPVELIGKVAKPFALAVRLFANMTAGHFVILALLGLILTFGSFASVTGWAAIVGPIALGLFVMFLEIFVALLQAYIFTVLTAVFIGLIRHAH
ncbi:MAG: F0F1 ATP synthase subunit A [Gemmatimonadota bacterium]